MFLKSVGRLIQQKCEWRQRPYRDELKCHETCVVQRHLREHIARLCHVRHIENKYNTALVGCISAFAWIKPMKLSSASPPNFDCCELAVGDPSPATSYISDYCMLGQLRHVHGFVSSMRESEPAVMFISHANGGKKRLGSLTCAGISALHGLRRQTVVVVPMPQSDRLFRVGCSR